jgi:glutathione S-transferase
MKLYGFGPTRSLRALWGLKELDTDFEFIPINLLAGEHKHPDFLRLNPAGKVPVLVDGDIVIPESAAIVLYLADKYREKRLLPASVQERAQVYRWVMFAVTELEQPLTSVFQRTLYWRKKSFSLWPQFSTLILKGVDSSLGIASQSLIASPRILSIGPTSST